MVDNANKAKFELVDRADEIVGKNGTVLIVSRQKIIQGNGISSEHIVVGKIRRNVDGTQAGVASSVFVPVDLAQKLIDAIMSLNKTKK